MILDFIKKTFHIREGELRISLLLQLYIFLVITVLLLVKPTINALFLSNLGSESLPMAYLLIAVTATLTAFFYDKVVKKFTIKSIAVVSLLIFSGVFALLSYFLQENIVNAGMLYAYYLSISIFGVLITSQFWIIANMVFNTREAKRLFSFISSGAIAGGIFGGYLTSIITIHFGNKYVILLASVFLICCVPIVIWLWNHRPHRFDEPDENTGTSLKESNRSAFQVIKSSNHLIYIACIVGVSVIVAKLVDFQFSDFAHIKITDSNELASFFGFWFSTFNVLSLVIQLFLTHKVLEWLGVTSSLLVLPLGISLGSILFLTFPELWVLVIIKGMDGSLKQSINKASMELSIMPISYTDKKQAKSFIDVVVDSIATGMAGFLLIFVIRGLNLSTHYITSFILFFLFVWIILIYKLRDTYFESFKNNIMVALHRDDHEHEIPTKFNVQKSTIKILNSSSEDAIINLLNNMEDTVTDVYKPHIINLLKHPSNKVKAAAIKEIYYFKQGEGATEIKALVTQNLDPEIVYEAMEYLLLHSDINEDHLFHDYLNHDKAQIADAALLCLAELTNDNPQLANKYHLKDRVTTKIRQSTNDEPTKERIAELLVTAGYTKDPKNFPYITRYLGSNDPYILNHAIKSAGLTKHITFIPLLINGLRDEPVRAQTIKSLQAYGKSIVDYLIKEDENQVIESILRQYFPQIVSIFTSEQASKFLRKLFNAKEAAIRYEAVSIILKQHLNGFKNEYPQNELLKKVSIESDYYENGLNHYLCLSKRLNTKTKLSTDQQIARENLLNVLKSEFDESIEIIFKLLSMLYKPADVEIAYYGLHENTDSIQSNSIELLDNILQFKDKDRVLSIIEYHNLHLGESVEDLAITVIEQEENDVIISLITNSNPQITHAVLEDMRWNYEPHYLPYIQKSRYHNDPQIAQKANEVLRDLA